MAGQSVILEEEIDENFEPSREEVLEYAKWLGMKLPQDEELLWIARDGLKAPYQNTGSRGSEPKPPHDLMLHLWSFLMALSLLRKLYFTFPLSPSLLLSIPPPSTPLIREVEACPAPVFFPSAPPPLLGSDSLMVSPLLSLPCPSLFRQDNPPPSLPLSLSGFGAPSTSPCSSRKHSPPSSIHRQSQSPEKKQPRWHGMSLSDGIPRQWQSVREAPSEAILRLLHLRSFPRLSPPPRILCTFRENVADLHIPPHCSSVRPFPVTTCANCGAAPSRAHAKHFPPEEDAGSGPHIPAQQLSRAVARLIPLAGFSAAPPPSL
eukprot:CAMPEP_0177581430 /NCGR_PEP_ID=MMETSP0419_2-20121207/2142_1 /TAXON_ID=582737 /ORGANISM="Tetraselmis sp., Strain GSL018" /LENGTH=318 /DNA_ID=CAMNT_0019070469 /DNA_START=420 /DNA_END=1373 /DNA_ORIENTATION=-